MVMISMKCFSRNHSQLYLSEEKQLGNKATITIFQMSHHADHWKDPEE